MESLGVFSRSPGSIIYGQKARIAVSDSATPSEGIVKKLLRRANSYIKGVC